MLQLARRLQTDLGYPMPTVGAFWSDKDVGQVKARDDLGTRGAVLADTQLGLTMSKWGVAPQGAMSKQGKVTESLDDFQQRNADALLFWGALSALYAENLVGEVHVWLPQGLTLGSIFWNDELPMLQKRLHSGEISALWFHVKNNIGVWSGPLKLEDLTIVDAYLADAQGVNLGGRSLIGDKYVPATLDDKYYQITLAKPIHIDLLQAGFRSALQRARLRLAAKAMNKTN
jgi:hypothetical protein